MRDKILEDIQSFIEEETNILCDDETNFNNADPTSGQRCYEEHEIASLIEDVMKERLFDKMEEKQ